MPVRADVARLAGVTPAVVSYVTNGNRPVSAETRRRVLDAIDALGYRPNPVARALVTSRSDTIGLIVPDSMNPYFVELTNAVEAAAFDVGFLTLLGNAAGDRTRESDYVQAFADRMVDGLIVLPTGGGQEQVERARAGGVPFVLVDRAERDLGVAHVVIDNRLGTYAATEHLIGHGRSTFGFIGGPEQNLLADGRALGFTDALADAGIDLHPDAIERTEFGLESGHAATTRLIERIPGLDAVVCSSDVQAIGAMHALHESHLVPGVDVAVFGFDGIQAGRFTWPPLSTVRQPTHLIAQQAIALLKNEIENRTSDSPEPVDVDDNGQIVAPDLVLRRSCGCPPDPTGGADGVTIPIQIPPNGGIT